MNFVISLEVGFAHMFENTNPYSLIIFILINCCMLFIPAEFTRD